MCLISGYFWRQYDKGEKWHEPPKPQCLSYSSLALTKKKFCHAKLPGILCSDVSSETVIFIPIQGPSKNFSATTINVGGPHQLSGDPDNVHKEGIR